LYAIFLAVSPHDVFNVVPRIQQKDCKPVKAQIFKILSYFFPSNKLSGKAFVNQKPGSQQFPSLPES